MLHFFTAVSYNNDISSIVLFSYGCQPIVLPICALWKWYFLLKSFKLWWHDNMTLQLFALCRQMQSARKLSREWQHFCQTPSITIFPSKYIFRKYMAACSYFAHRWSDLWSEKKFPISEAIHFLECFMIYT